MRLADHPRTLQVITLGNEKYILEFKEVLPTPKGLYVDVVGVFVRDGERKGKARGMQVFLQTSADVALRMHLAQQAGVGLPRTTR